VSPAVARAAAALVVFAFSGTLATALSICDAQKAQEAKQAERTLAAAADCDRPAIVKAYRKNLEELTRQARLAEEHLGFDATEAASYLAEIDRAEASVAGLKNVDPLDLAAVARVVTDVEGKIQTVMGRIKNGLDGLEEAGREPVCEADLSEKRSQIWKTTWDECPPPVVEEPEPDVAPEGESEGEPDETESASTTTEDAPD